MLNFKSVTMKLAKSEFVAPVFFLLGLLVFTLIFPTHIPLVVFVFSIGWLIGYVSDSFVQYFIKP